MQRLLPTTLRLSRQSPAAIRSISHTPARWAGHGPKPTLYGEGAKAGEVPSDEQQATGLERLQLLGRMKGVDVFNETPLDSSRIGTLEDPIVVPSLAKERIIGCSGSPADSHDTIWIPLNIQANRRCPECGSVYKLGYESDGSEDHAHH